MSRHGGNISGGPVKKGKIKSILRNNSREASHDASLAQVVQGRLAHAARMCRCACFLGEMINAHARVHTARTHVCTRTMRSRVCCAFYLLIVTIERLVRTGITHVSCEQSTVGGLSSLDKDKQQAALQLRESKTVRFRKPRDYSQVKVCA